MLTLSIRVCNEEGKRHEKTSEQRDFKRQQETSGLQPGGVEREHMLQTQAKLPPPALERKWQQKTRGFSKAHTPAP
jgi:hypothetical protein